MPGGQVQKESPRRFEEKEVKIKRMSLANIKPYEGNPRKISEEAVETVADSIDRFGFNQPLVVNQDGIICVGHTRYLAAKKLGLKTVPVYQKGMTDSDFKKYNINDNKSGEISKWDAELLVEIFGDLGEDIDGTGFSEIEIQNFMEPVEEAVPPSDDDAYEGEEEGDEKSPLEKMFGIAIPSEKYDRFMAALDALAEHHGLPDQSTTVFKTITDCADGL